MSEQSSSDSPARGMESIAHLFLSQSRGDRGRVPPRVISSSISDAAAEPTVPSSSTGTPEAPLDDEKFLSEDISPGVEIRYNASERESNRDEEDILMSEASLRDHSQPAGEVRFHGVVLWTDHLSSAEETASRFARQWAQKNEAVGFFRLDADLSELFEFQSNVGGGSDLSTKEWQELLGEGTAGFSGVEASLKPALAELAERCDILLICAESELRQKAVDLLEHCRHAVVATTPEPNDMLAAYKAIKKLSPTTWEDKDISVFVCGAEDESSARLIYDKLAKTAWDFLAVDLSWGGWEQPVDNVAERHLAAVETREEILLELVEVLSPHIETAERKESSQFSVHSSPEEEEVEVESEEGEEEREDSSQFTVHSSQGEEEEAKEQMKEASMPAQAWAWHPAVGMAPEKGEVLSPVVVVKLPRSDGELADVLQLALPCWLKGIVTPMILPLSRSSDMDKSVRFLVDGNGRLFVLGASLAASEDAFAKALQGRKWLEDNLSMILSSCPQVRIDRSLEAGVILVAGGDVSFLHESVSQIQEFPIVVKQLHLLQNEAGSSLLIL